MQKIAAGMIVAVALALTAVCATAEGDKKNAVASPKPAPRDQKGQRRKGAVTKKMTTPYRKIETKNYVIETPEGWEVGQETSFGQREIRPAKETKADRDASMSSMTGPGLGRQSWQQLYETSLYFITRYAANGQKMQATPFTLGQSRLGFETCTWTMTDPDGLPLQRHVILKHSNGNILALSVKIPSAAAMESKERLEAIFQHMVDTAVVR
jgi:hypothetical protein